MALGVVLGQLASMPGVPQRDRADYHDEAVLALQQAVACDPVDVNILYNLALVQVWVLRLFPVVVLTGSEKLPGRYRLSLLAPRICKQAFECVYPYLKGY